MEEIQIGEYVRTVGGTLGKIIDFCDGVYTLETRYGDLQLYIVDISKHSFNIIDLIEVGDYVNGMEIISIDKINNTIYLEWENMDTYSTNIENDKFIKEILTKEQYENNCYKLEE